MHQQAATREDSRAANLVNGWTVYPQWPEANTQLAGKVITVIQSGVPQFDLCSRQTVAQNNKTSILATYTWSLYQVRLQMQLDIWCTSSVDRDDAHAQLDALLNKGVSLISSIADPVAEGVVLNFNAADGWNGTCDYIFDSPMPMWNPNDVQQVDYRSTSRGEARYALVESSDAARITSIIAKIKAHETAIPASSTQLNDITTITASGVTHTQG